MSMNIKQRPIRTISSAHSNPHPSMLSPLTPALTRCPQPRAREGPGAPHQQPQDLHHSALSTIPAGARRQLSNAL